MLHHDSNTHSETRYLHLIVSVHWAHQVSHSSLTAWADCPDRQTDRQMELEKFVSVSLWRSKCQHFTGIFPDNGNKPSNDGKQRSTQRILSSSNDAGMTANSKSGKMLPKPQSQDTKQQQQQQQAPLVETVTRSNRPDQRFMAEERMAALSVGSKQRPPRSWSMWNPGWKSRIAIVRDIRGRDIFGNHLRGRGKIGLGEEIEGRITATDT